MSRMSLRSLTLAAVLAAVYAVMTVALPHPPVRGHPDAHL